MALPDLITKVIGAIIPDMDADPRHQLRWRISVATLLLGSVTVQVTHVLIACGWLASYGISGFAYASDLDALLVSQTRMEIRQINNHLMELDAALCKAMENGKSTRYITEQIREEINEYKLLSGEQWTRPTCAELGE